MKKSIILNLLFLLSVPQFMLSSETVLQYEIVPFDYAADDMRQQICDMVADDADIQQMTHETKESMRKMLSSPDVKHQLQCIVCRTTDGMGIICGFMIYFISHRAYFVGNPDMQSILFNPTYADEFEILTPVPDLVDFGFIDDIAVHKDYRGQGIAQAMLHYFEQDCRDRGILTLLLGVEAENYKARRAYSKFGFKVHPVYSTQIMVKKLN
ncbi:GNAT family N-acetyltransferase [Candidatus Babeliales bacterium]|nr:GNAT family N-acetyltransferase [Candidatus Babeliales bacterium]MBP9843510.1 GNAT family N-acetyltransferase [Candidatus Babeliales bacterium]